MFPLYAALLILCVGAARSGFALGGVPDVIPLDGSRAAAQEVDAPHVEHLRAELRTLFAAEYATPVRSVRVQRAQRLLERAIETGAARDLRKAFALEALDLSIAGRSWGIAARALDVLERDFGHVDLDVRIRARAELDILDERDRLLALADRWFHWSQVAQDADHARFALQRSRLWYDLVFATRGDDHVRGTRAHRAAYRAAYRDPALDAARDPWIAARSGRRFVVREAAPPEVLRAIDGAALQLAAQQQQHDGSWLPPRAGGSVVHSTSLAPRALLASGDFGRVRAVDAAHGRSVRSSRRTSHSFLSAA